MTPTKASRKKAERAGRLGEWAAAFMLQLKGYVIVQRRMKSRLGEVDLIARHAKVLAFIEVKVRAKPTDPATILSPYQMKRIVNGATGWASSRPWAHGCQWRYDLIIVRPWHWPLHIKDAWRPTHDPALERGTKAGNVTP
jgi:putative endonuclease